MGSKGSEPTTTNTTQTYSPHPSIAAGGQQAITGAQSAAGLPFQMPVAPVAGFSPFQNLGFGATLAAQGMAQPYFGAGSGYLQGSAAPISGGDVAQYYNPMASNVFNQMGNIFGQQRRDTTGRLTQAAGGVGADRIAVGQAQLANQQGLAAGQTASDLYQKALQAAQQQKQMMAGAGYGLAQMGPSAQASQLQGIQALMGAGGMQQALQQQMMNAQYQNQLAQIAYPFQTPQYLAGIIGGLAPAMGGTTAGQSQTTYPQPSALSQALGIGTSALGMFGGMGGFGGGGQKGSMPSTGYTGTAMGTPFGGAPNSMYWGGQQFPMFRSGGRVGFADGGAADDDSSYGEIADRYHQRQLGNIIPAAEQGNPIAEIQRDTIGGSLPPFAGGGNVEPIRMSVPQIQSAFDRLKASGNLNREAALDYWASRSKQLGIDPMWAAGREPRYADGGHAEWQRGAELMRERQRRLAEEPPRRTEPIYGPYQRPEEEWQRGAELARQRQERLGNPAQNDESSALGYLPGGLLGLLSGLGGIAATARGRGRYAEGGAADDPSSPTVLPARYEDSRGSSGIGGALDLMLKPGALMNSLGGLGGLAGMVGKPGGLLQALSGRGGSGGGAGFGGFGGILGGGMRGPFAGIAAGGQNGPFGGLLGSGKDGQFGGILGGGRDAPFGGVLGGGFGDSGARGFAEGGSAEEAPVGLPFPGVSIPKAGGASPIPTVSLPMGAGHSGPYAGQGIDIKHQQQPGGESGGGGGEAAQMAKLAMQVLPMLLIKRGGRASLGGPVDYTKAGQGFATGGAYDLPDEREDFLGRWPSARPEPPREIAGWGPLPEETVTPQAPEEDPYTTATRLNVEETGARRQAEEDRIVGTGESGYPNPFRHGVGGGYGDPGGPIPRSALQTGPESAAQAAERRQAEEDRIVGTARLPNPFQQGVGGPMGDPGGPIPKSALQSGPYLTGWEGRDEPYESVTLPPKTVANPRDPRHLLRSLFGSGSATAAGEAPVTPPTTPPVPSGAPQAATGDMAWMGPPSPMGMEWQAPPAGVASSTPMPRARPDIPGPSRYSPEVPPISPAAVRQETMRAAHDNDVPIDLALSLINQESGFRVNAVGGSGEIGPGQITAGTARELGINRHNPYENIHGAMKYLKRHFDQFKSWPAAVAAYNAGPDAVARGRIPASTRNSYVPAVMAGRAGNYDNLSESTDMSASRSRYPRYGDERGQEGFARQERGFGFPDSERPYPGAREENWGTRMARSPWMSLVRAGATMASTPGPIGSVIGKGITAGANELSGQRKELRSEEEINQKAQGLYQAAQVNLDKYQSENWKPTYATTAKGHPILMDSRSGNLKDGVTGEQVDPDEHLLNTRGAAGSQSGALWDKKHAAWLEEHPGDRKGALEYAAGRRQVPAAQLATMAAREAEKDAAANLSLGLDSTAREKYKAERQQFWQRIFSGAAATEAAPAAKPLSPEGAAAVAAAKAAIAAGKDKEGVKKKLKEVYGIDPSLVD